MQVVQNFARKTYILLYIENKVDFGCLLRIQYRAHLPSVTVKVLLSFLSGQVYCVCAFLYLPNMPTVYIYIYIYLYLYIYLIELATTHLVCYGLFTSFFHFLVCWQTSNFSQYNFAVISIKWCKFYLKTAYLNFLSIAMSVKSFRMAYHSMTKSNCNNQFGFQQFYS